MPSSRILKEEEASLQVFTHQPKKFPVQVPEQAETFVRANSDLVASTSGFQLDELISRQIGVEDSGKKVFEEKVEQQAIERLKEVQEQAYKEAYDLGLEEGRQQAFDQVSQQLAEKIQNLNEMMGSISTLKKDLVTFNESHIMKLVAFLAGKVAMKEMSLDKEAIVPILIDAVQDAQGTEKIIVRVSPSDLEFIESTSEELSKKIEGFENVRFEKDADITSGGCVVESNFGVVDATIEQRVQKVWSAFEDKVPVVKDKIGA